MQRIIAPLTFVGLLLSAGWHIGLLLHHDLVGQGGTDLFIGIFVVWFPTVFYLRRFGSTMQRRTGWKVWLAGSRTSRFP